MCRFHCILYRFCPIFCFENNSILDQFEGKTGFKRNFCWQKLNLRPILACIKILKISTVCSGSSFSVCRNGPRRRPAKPASLENFARESSAVRGYTHSHTLALTT